MTQAFSAKFGVYPTMVTPFQQVGSLDEGVVRDIVSWYWQNGVDGIFAVCQSSEMAFLTPEEKVRLARTVIDQAALLARIHPERPRMQIVVSGHTDDDPAQQARVLNELAQTGPDALVLVSNRMDVANTGDDAWIAETDRLIAQLPDEMMLGMYECPVPYKRLMSDAMLRWCGQTGRFHFMKDTCCDAALIAHRLQVLEGTPFRLMNANGQTLLQSLRDGAHGYSGVMANFFPDLIVWLCHHFREQPEKAALVQAFLSTASFTESLPYPVTAKFHLQALAQLPVRLTTRTRPETDLTAYAEDCIRQMARLAGHIRTQL